MNTAAITPPEATGLTGPDIIWVILLVTLFALGVFELVRRFKLTPRAEAFASVGLMVVCAVAGWLIGAQASANGGLTGAILGASASLLAPPMLSRRVKRYLGGLFDRLFKRNGSK